MGTDGMNPTSFGEGMPLARPDTDFPSAAEVVATQNPDDLYFADDQERPNVAGRVGDLKAQGILDENGRFSEDYLASRRPADPLV